MPASLSAGGCCGAATAQRAGEPAWHRRQRRIRAQARVIARIAAAKSVLADHHSAQRRPSSGFSGGGRMAKQANDAQAASGQRRGPPWSCNCGAVDNWGDRRKCRVCKRDAPAAVLRRQKEAQAAANAQATSAGGSGGKQRGGGGAGGAAARAGSAARSAPSYASVARSNGNDDISRELADLRRANEQLQRQVAALRAGNNEEPEEDDAMDTGNGEKEREERIKVLGDNLKYVALVFSEESDEYRAKKAELDSLVRARREGKPLNVQIQRVDRRIEAQKKRLAKAEEQVGLERQRVVDAQSDLAAAQKEAAETKSGLEELEGERKQLLIREARALEQQAPAPAQPAVVSEVEAWERTMGAIAVRIRAPGVQPELAAEVGQVLDALRGLCSRLPAEIPADPAPAPPAAAAPPTPAIPAVDAPALAEQPPTGAHVDPAVSSAPAAAAAGSAAEGNNDGTGADGDATDSDELQVDAEGDEESAFAGIPAEQRERIREIMARRRRPATAGRLKKPEDKPSGNPKKPAKGGE